MKSVRRPAVAVSTMLVLVIIQAAADPTGLLALVGWSGAQPQLAAGLWPFAPYLVFLPVLLGVVWWVAVRAGDRYWTLTAGITLAVLLAQAAACLVMTLNIPVAAQAAGYVAAKAVPAALIVSAFARWFGGATNRQSFASGSLWPLVGKRRAGASASLWIPAAIFALVTPLLAGVWWTGAVYAPGVPAARLDRGPISVTVAVLLIAVATGLCLRWMRSRVPGVLGGWLAALVAGGIVGIVQAAIAFAVDGGLNGDLWPLMAAYVAVADGLAFGACVGWVVGVSAVVADRIREGRWMRVPRLAGPAAAVIALIAVIVGASLTGTDAAPAEAAGSDASVPAGFLRADGRIIADGHGNQVLLRGVNVNQLVPGPAAVRVPTRADAGGARDLPPSSLFRGARQARLARRSRLHTPQLHDRRRP